VKDERGLTVRERKRLQSRVRLEEERRRHDEAVLEELGVLPPLSRTAIWWRRDRHCTRRKRNNVAIVRDDGDP
jgi:hypothetical protein